MVINELLDAIERELRTIDEVDEVIQIGAGFGSEQAKNEKLSNRGATVLVGCPGGNTNMIGNRISLDANVLLYIFARNNRANEHRSDDACDVAFKIAKLLNNSKLRIEFKDIYGDPKFSSIEEFALKDIDEYSCWLIAYNQQILL